MKKMLCVTVALMAMIFRAATSMAAPINFYDLKEGAIFDFDAVGPTTSVIEKTWTFDLDQDFLFSSWDGSGMDPYGDQVDINAGDTIRNAWVEINFYEDDYILNANGVERLVYRENAALIVDGVTLFANREINTGFVHRNIGISFLDDHIVELTIRSTNGDFDVQNLFVGGTFKDNTAAPVPEPGTMLLFGSGLFGLAAVGRKKINQRTDVNK